MSVYTPDWFTRRFGDYRLFAGCGTLVPVRATPRQACPTEELLERQRSALPVAVALVRREESTAAPAVAGALGNSSSEADTHNASSGTNWPPCGFFVESRATARVGWPTGREAASARLLASLLLATERKSMSRCD